MPNVSLQAVPLCNVGEGRRFAASGKCAASFPEPGFSMEVCPHLFMFSGKHVAHCR